MTSVLVSYASTLKTESSGDLNMRTDERSCFMSSPMQEVTIAFRTIGSTSEALIAVSAYSSIVLEVSVHSLMKVWVWTIASSD